MKPYTSEHIRGYAKWLTQERQAAGLDGEQYGADDVEELVRSIKNVLAIPPR